MPMSAGRVDGNYAGTLRSALPRGDEAGTPDGRNLRGGLTETMPALWALPCLAEMKEGHKKGEICGEG